MSDRSALRSRIRGSVRFDTGDPMVVLTGRGGAADCFVDADYLERSFDESIWPLLREVGFRRILFSSPDDAFYWLDTESGAHVAQDIAEPAPRRGQTLDASSFGLLNSCIHAPEVTTAVVILRAESFLESLASHKALAEKFAGWCEPTAIADNLCMLVCDSRSADTFTELARSLRFNGLVAYLERQRGRRTASALMEMGEPDLAEIERIVHLIRLRYDQKVDWRELDRIVATLAAQPAVLAGTWMRRLRGLARSGSELSMEALRARRWVEALPSGQSAWDRLCGLTGLTQVKEHVDRLRWRAEAEASRRRAGITHEPDSLHMVFTGGPGTGKTTVAGLIGELYREMGLLRRGHVHAPEAAELIGMYVGHTAVQTNKAVDAALDGVLFIDEAYRLSEHPGGFGQEAIDSLVTRMDNDRDRLVVVAAGYSDKMEDFLRSNPGLPRRFPRSNIIEFPDYEPDELLTILIRMLRDRGLIWTADLEGVLRALIVDMHAARDHTFGNAGEMRNLAQEIETNWARRVRAVLTEPVTPADVPMTRNAP